MILLPLELYRKYFWLAYANTYLFGDRGSSTPTCLLIGTILEFAIGGRSAFPEQAICGFPDRDEIPIVKCAISDGEHIRISIGTRLDFPMGTISGFFIRDKIRILQSRKLCEFRSGPDLYFPMCYFKSNVRVLLTFIIMDVWIQNCSWVRYPSTTQCHNGYQKHNGNLITKLRANNQ